MARWTRFRRLFGPEPKADVDAELAFHVEMRMRELIEQGETPERARRARPAPLRRLRRLARRNVVAINERRRRRHGTHGIPHRTAAGRRLRAAHAAPHARLHARRAARRWRSASAPTAPSSASSTACCLQSLPFRDAERLYHVRCSIPTARRISLSAPDFMSVREQTRTFEQVEAFVGRRLHDARRRRAARGSRRDRERRPVRHARAAGRARPRRSCPKRISRDTAASRCSITASGSASSAAIAACSAASVTIGGMHRRRSSACSRRARSCSDAADVYVPLAFDDTFSAATAKGRRGEFLDGHRPGEAGQSLPRRSTTICRRIGAQLQTAFPDTNGTLTFNADAARAT